MEAVPSITAGQRQLQQQQLRTGHSVHCQAAPRTRVDRRRRCEHGRECHTDQKASDTHTHTHSPSRVQGARDGLWSAAKAARPHRRGRCFVEHFVQLLSCIYPTIITIATATANTDTITIIITRELNFTRLN